LFVGWSCGSAVHGALEYAREYLSEEDVMVIILPDHGTRYLGKIYNDNWMKDHGFYEARDFATAKDIITGKNGRDQLFTVSRETRVGDVIRMLNSNGIDQVPVIDGDHFVGSITTGKILETLVERPECKDEPVDNIMDDPMPFVAMDNTLDVLSSMMNKNTKAVLVRDQNDDVHIVTQHDLLAAITA
jgi:cystathionine beta-synthase